MIGQLLLGAQILVGALCFALGCIRVEIADERLNRRVPGAIQYGIVTVLLVFFGLALYSSGAIIMLFYLT